MNKIKYKIKKNYYDDKKFYLYDRLFVSNRIFTNEHINIVKNSRFFVQNSRLFHL